MDPYTITCQEYIQIVFATYDLLNVNFFEKVVGREFRCSTDFLIPRHNRRDLATNSTEWDIVDPSYTPNIAQPIEVCRNMNGELVVVDGHHRLKFFLAKGQKWVRIKLVGEQTMYA